MRSGAVTLEDKYTARSGRVFLTGIQALVRLPLVQQWRDRAAGLDTAGFVSGYRGSPLGGLDLQLARAGAHLQQHRVHFQAGVNEDLALTAVWGTQMLGVSRAARHEGIHALWYGKAPGVDRSGDALKHGNAAGSARRGGVLVVAGDDHECKSSTLPSQSEYALLDAGVPVLNPASVQEVLDYGLLGWGLSRFAGCWAGLIALADTMDSSATIDADTDRIPVVWPEAFVPPEGGLHFRADRSPLEQEVLVHGARLEAALAFARANRIDRTLVDAPDARLGIVTTGKATLDVLQALEDLGLDPDSAGIRVYKVGMPWPLEPEGLRAFAAGLDEILVVEEKRDLIESQIRDHLYALPRRPRVVGKRDDHGAPLLPANGALSPGLVARAIARRLPRDRHDERLRARLVALQRGESALEVASSRRTRQPFYCSGCPHNTSTVLPEGSRGLAGIGCHYMVRWMGRNTDTVSQMGGEGVQWIGQAPFTDEEHVFVNLGDGTYFHSGVLAIRAAVAAGVNVTYKILYNDAVAMTGGQSIDGALDVPGLTRQLAAEGVTRIVLVSDEPDHYPADAVFAPAVTRHHRRELDSLQRSLRETPGCSVLVYDQTCAAELRRRRKRGEAPQKPRIFINEAVCEGCGDCSAVSNCVSIEPVETELGRKRRVDQTSCNLDASCVEGLCPSFATVTGGRLRRTRPERAEPDPAALRALPAPEIGATDEPWNLVLTGVGGTGIVTLGALVGMAAHIEGRASTVLDMTGLAQKGGAVISHVRIADCAETIHTPRISTGRAHALLACDLIVAGSRDAAVKLDASTTRCVVNTHLAPTAEFVLDNATRYDASSFLSLLHEFARSVDTVDGSGLAKRLFGDTTAANVFLLGYGFQRGLVPLAADALEAAITLNGIAVEANLRAFRWGRIAAHDPESLDRQASAPRRRARAPRTLDALIARRTQLLIDYDGPVLAARYRALVDAVREAEGRLGPHAEELTRATATAWYKLLAVKDEYEVARLYSDGRFRAQLDAELEGDYRVSLLLAPPLFSRDDPATGRPRKRAYGPWMLRVLGWLARARRLRGTRFDPFGYTRERRLERRLAVDYERTLRSLLPALGPENHAIAIEIAGLPEEIRGFGAVKEAAFLLAAEREKPLVERFFKHERARAPDGVVRVDASGSGVRR